MEVYLVWRLRPQARMRALAVLEREVSADLGSRLGHRLIGMKIDVLVFERAPQPLDEDVVCPAALAIHADLDAFFLKPPSESFTGELRALIGVEDFRPAVHLDCLLQRLDAAAGIPVRNYT